MKVFYCNGSCSLCMVLIVTSIFISGKIRPFYAVKCNPDLEIIRTLAILGASFDCASKSEIETVINVGVNLQAELGDRNMAIGPERIGFFHPYKMRSHLRYAKAIGVQKMTFDSLYELQKISDMYGK